MPTLVRTQVLLLFISKVLLKHQYFNFYLSTILQNYFYFYLSKNIPNCLYTYLNTNAKYFLQHW